MTKQSIKLDLVRLRGKARREGWIVDVMLGLARPPVTPASAPAPVPRSGP